MKVTHPTVLGAFCVGLLGCGTQVTPADVVVPEDGQTRVSRLLLLTTVELPDGSTLSEAHVRSLTLQINGTAWGSFRSEGFGPNAMAQDRFTTTTTASPALFIADLAREADTQAELLENIGDWTEFLSRYLGPGGYVAEATKIELEDNRGNVIVLPTRRYLPFDINSNDESAFIGEATFVVPEELL